MRITRLCRSRSALSILPFLVVPMAACEQPTEPPEVIRPTLQDLRVETNHLGSGILRVVAVPEDPAFQAEPSQRIEVQIREGGRDGDEETLLLGPAYCGGDDGALVHKCDEFVVALTSTADFEMLGDRARQLPGRLLRSGLVDQSTGGVYESTGHATVAILGGRLGDAMSQARSWAGVRYVQPSHVGRIAILPGPPAGTFTAVIAAVEGASSAGDGVFQYRHGGTIELRYDAPGGEPRVSVVTIDD